MPREACVARLAALCRVPSSEAASKVPGLEFAGEIEAVGAAVTALQVGDRVFGWRLGANAEYLCVKEAGLIPRMPEGVSFEEAAAVCDGFFQANQHLQRAKVSKGTRLLVYGGSGWCGTAESAQAGDYGPDAEVVVKATI